MQSARMGQCAAAMGLRKRRNPIPPTNVRALTHTRTSMQHRRRSSVGWSRLSHICAQAPRLSLRKACLPSPTLLPPELPITATSRCIHRYCVPMLSARHACPPWFHVPSNIVHGRASTQQRSPIPVGAIERAEASPWLRAQLHGGFPSARVGYRTVGHASTRQLHDGDASKSECTAPSIHAVCRGAPLAPTEALCALMCSGRRPQRTQLLFIAVGQACAQHTPCRLRRCRTGHRHCGTTVLGRGGRGGQLNCTSAWPCQLKFEWFRRAVLRAVHR